MSERRLSELRSNPNNPRKQIRDEGFPELAASIRVQGVLQPLLITEDGLILAGHRRYEAAKDAGLETVPVHIFTAIEDKCVCALSSLISTSRKGHALPIPTFIQS